MKRVPCGDCDWSAPGGARRVHRSPGRLRSAGTCPSCDRSHREFAGRYRCAGCVNVRL